MDGVGGMAGWRWIFILEGVATVVVALYAYIVLPSDLYSARFFNEDERAFAGTYQYRAQYAILNSEQSIDTMERTKQFLGLQRSRIRSSAKR